MAQPEQLIDKERQRYYDMMESLFGHPGWQSLMNDAQEIANRANQIDSIDAEHSLDYRRGERDNARWLLNLQAIHRQCYDIEMAQQFAVAPQDEDTLGELGLL